MFSKSLGQQAGSANRADIVEVEASHVPFTSKPKVVAEVIEKAAHSSMNCEVTSDAKV